jgi:hypothetical protein
MHINYLPNIAYFQELLNNKEFVFHLNDIYHRQTYRNRTEIVGPNGKMVLSIPTLKLEPGERNFENIRISYSESWLKQHWKSFESAYRRSVYFEYYEDKFKELYKKPSFEYLWEFNFELIKSVLSVLKIQDALILNRESKIEDKTYNSLYFSKQYTQVFSSKIAFEENLSIIDLIFNTGPNAKQYLMFS